MLRAERLTLATDTLVYFAHWITPEVQPLRFDTRFFAATMPEGQEAIADEREITEVRWLTPGEAIDGERARAALAPQSDREESAALRRRRDDRRGARRD